MISNLSSENPIFFLFWIVAILASLTVHEYLHAWTANYLGDDTAKLSGRLTLNPIAHLDPIGSIMILFFGFGWAKPVPVNFLHFKNPKMGNALVSVAGPLANLVFALVLSLIYRLFPASNEFFKIFIYLTVFLNVRVAVFNLMPVPPLDGSHLLSVFFKDLRKLKIFESYGSILLVPFILFIGPVIIEPISDFIMNLLIK